ncbi:hypothetical protein HYS03_01585 [Candidatus Woesebacteria bacterium]|nr:hypothetical protein [Candidatus Woesebacteria bacterium]QQG47010.1 MAG: hypothetical protein HY044_02625 [Candidatus Woesebacteria bacterium]
MQKITKHLQHYSPLIGIFIVGIVGFWVFSYSKNFQIALSLSMCVGYISWGIVHHALHKNLSIEVVVEYIFFATLGFLLMYSIISRS